MTDEKSDDNALLIIVREQVIKGKNFLDIERLFGIPAPKAEAIYRDYYGRKVVDPVAYRMLQMERLESMIDVLMTMAQLGNIKSAEVLLKNLEQINTLLGLNLQATKVEVRVINERQSEVVYKVTNGVTNHLLAFVQGIVTDQKQLAQIEDGWDDAVSEHFITLTEEVIEAEMIES